MQGLSAFHWLILLVITGCFFILPSWLGIRHSRNVAPLTRGNYITQVLLVIAGAVVLDLLTAIGASFVSLAWPLLQYLLAWATARRLADAALNRNWAWLMAIPFLNLLIALVLSCWRGKARMDVAGVF